MKETAREDVELWEKLRQGDREALATLFERLYEQLWLYGTKLISDRGLVEDSIQEMFIDLLEKEHVPAVEFVRAYLLKSLRYKLIRVSQQKMARQKKELESYPGFSFDSFEPAADETAGQWRRERLLKAMETLSDRQREIIYLRFYQFMQYEEIAEVMKLNYQTSRNLLYKAIKSLRANWDALAADAGKSS